MADPVRATLENFAAPDERAALRALLDRAAALDAERAAVTARINTLRCRLSHRRLAAERGQPFRRAKPRRAPLPA